MIYTLTLNPAIDHVVFLSELKRGELNRANAQSIVFGGKGINVSVMLNELGIRTCALGFIAGFTGRAIGEGLAQGGIPTDFICLKDGITRINIKLKCGDETEINSDGPEISEDDIGELFLKFKGICAGDHLVLSGSVPKSVPEDIYERIMAKLGGRGINFTVDTGGKRLKSALKYHPFLIKPNADELGEIFEDAPKSRNEVEQAASELREMGAKNVLVSMGQDGSILAAQDGKVYHMGVAHGELKNSVGAGDSMVAGFLTGYIQTRNVAYAQLLGTAAGGATAFCEGIAKRQDVMKMVEELKSGK